MLLALLIFGGAGVTAQKPAGEIIPKEFIGNWCTNTGYEVTETYFNLVFSEESALFYDGTRFMEEFTAKNVGSGALELYFDVFMDTGAEGDTGVSRPVCESRVMSCKLISDREMEITTYPYDCGRVQPRMKFTIKKLASYESCRPELEITDDYSPAEYSRYFSPDELMALIGKPSPENIADLFLLLPDSDCLEIPAEERKKMLKGEVLEDYSFMRMGDLDLTHQYMNMEGAIEGKWEIFARKDGNRWLTAVNTMYCGAECYTAAANTYSFENGHMTLESDMNFAGHVNLQAEHFIDFSQLNAAQKATAKQLWQEIEGSVLYDLPRDGKTLTIAVDPLRFIEFDIPEDAMKTLTTEMWK